MYRIGTGFDIHRLVEGRKLILGGVEIPHNYGLKGHSDADVLTHAICDALLGAMGEKDIGNHFPDTDSEYEDISSMNLLGRVNELLKSKGFEIVNIDSVIICEKPMLLPYIDQMKDKLSDILDLPKELLGIKATTSEGLGVIGREEGIAANATVLVKEI